MEEADKERLLKRASLDLTGLPPSLDMMDESLSKDASPNAYEKMIDELMNMPQYGEKDGSALAGCGPLCR